MRAWVEDRKGLILPPCAAPSREKTTSLGSPPLLRAVLATPPVLLSTLQCRQHFWKKRSSEISFFFWNPKTRQLLREGQIRRIIIIDHFKGGRVREETGKGAAEDGRRTDYRGAPGDHGSGGNGRDDGGSGGRPNDAERTPKAAGGPSLRGTPPGSLTLPLPSADTLILSFVSAVGRLRGGRGGADLRPAHAPVLAHSAILGEHCGHPVGERFDNFGENEARGPRGVARVLPLEEQSQNEKVEWMDGMGFGNNGGLGVGGRVPWYENCRI